MLKILQKWQDVAIWRTFALCWKYCKNFIAIKVKDIYLLIYGFGV